jgi:hypothetical protein
MNFDNTHKKVKRTRTQPFYDYGVYDEQPLPYPSTASTSQDHETGGGGNEPNGDISPDAEFSITINGTASTQDPQGIVIPATSFTLGCVDGTYTLTHPNVNSSTAPSDTVEKEISLNQSLSATFPVADGDEIYTVYGKIKYNITNGKITGISNDSKIVAVAAEDVDDKVGWDVESSTFTFNIGSVMASKRGSQRRVFVNQVHSGPYLHGFNAIEPVSVFSFEIIRANDGTNNVVVAQGFVMDANGNTITPTGSAQDPQQGTKFGFGNSIYINVSLSTGSITGATLSTTAGTPSSSTAVIPVGSVSSDGVITNGLKGKSVVQVYACGNNNFFDTF